MGFYCFLLHSRGFKENEHGNNYLFSLPVLTPEANSISPSDLPCEDFSQNDALQWKSSFFPESVAYQQYL